MMPKLYKTIAFLSGTASGYYPLFVILLLVSSIMAPTTSGKEMFMLSNFLKLTNSPSLSVPFAISGIRLPQG